jgi:ribosomal protein S18 acetylase RimI-like enzyme
MIEQIRLRDGTDGFVLPLQRTDKATLVAEFETLAPESRRRRFLSAVTHLSDSMLEHLVDDVDGIDHVALVLCAETSPDVYDPVALARMVRYADASDAADLAVTVKDAWHGRGVATALLEVLVRERPAGVDRVVTEVFSDNQASVSMLCRLGRTTVDDLGSGVSKVVVDLAPLGDLGVTRWGRRHRTRHVGEQRVPACRRGTECTAARPRTPARAPHARPGLSLVQLRSACRHAHAEHQTSGERRAADAAAVPRDRAPT